MSYRFKGFLPYGILVLVFIATAALRPLLPVDETRYLTVAWEMYLRGDLVQLSLNFEPYHHKPPMLFWLINLCWHIFGVSRAVALLPVFAASAAVLYLSGYLAGMLFTDKARAAAPYIMLSSLPFIAYSSMMMFDIMMAAFTLACHISLLKYATSPKLLWPAFAGIILGLALLTKGPVAFLYVIGPVIFYPLWRQESYIGPAQYYRGFALAVLVSLLPILLWLVPLSMESDHNFLWWLLWEQSAGRVTGNFNAAHARPYYFYMLLLPLMALPWVLFPTIWKKVKTVYWKSKTSLFCITATIPAFCIFSLIAGKQPHYFVPLFPYVALMLSDLLSDKKEFVRYTALAMTGLFITGHLAGHFLIFPHFDLRPFAAIYNQHAEKDWAFVRNYQGELGFLARVDNPIDNLNEDSLKTWIKAHPDGYVIARYKKGDDHITGMKTVFSAPYRGKQLGIFHAGKE